MAIKMVFEDGENTPSSILLKNTFYGKNIYFSNGVSCVLDKAMQIKEADDIIYIFYDMSPNNRKTVKGYEDLVRVIHSDKQTYRNLYVIPIICIEYHICKMFDKYQYFCTKNAKALEMIDKLVKTFDWEHILEDIKDDQYTGASLEHVYKNILDLQRMPCLHNRFQYNRNDMTRNLLSPEGIFYEKDCVCERKFCSINCEDIMIVKAERLYSSLPVTVGKTEEYCKLRDDLEIEDKMHEEIKAERQQFYRMVCNNMKLKMPKISI